MCKNIIKNFVLIIAISCAFISCKQSSNSQTKTSDSSVANLSENENEDISTSSNAISSSKKNGKCGIGINKCSSGVYSDLPDSNSLAIWVCNGVNGGTSIQCSTEAQISGQCSTALNSCTKGTFVDLVDTSSLNKWSCRGTNGGKSTDCSKIKVQAGSCGSVLNKCATGSFADQEDSPTLYKWSCQGSGGQAAVYCTMNRPVNGQCSTAPNQCLKGNFLDIADTETISKWECTGLYSGTKASCSKVKPVSGVCSTTTDQCTKGTFVDATDDDTYYKWTCNGLNGGSNISCRNLKPSNGQCGSSVNQCTKGALVDIADSSTSYLWNCAGIAGGSTANCTITKPTSTEVPFPPFPLRTAPTQIQYSTILDQPLRNSSGKYDVFYPTNYANAPERSIPVFIWLNNTFWSYGDRVAGRSFAQRLADRGFIVYNIEVPLGPQFDPNGFPNLSPASSPYTSGYIAFKDAAELSAATIADFKGDPTRISIGGMEAGMHTMLLAAANSSLTFNCLIGSSGPTDLKSLYNDSMYPATKWLVTNVFGQDTDSLEELSPINKINNIKARRLYFNHQNKNNLFIVSQTSRFVDAAKTRFGSNVEATYFNDSLGPGQPLVGPATSQLNSLVNLAMFDDLVSFISKKCY